MVELPTAAFQGARPNHGLLILTLLGSDRGENLDIFDTFSAVNCRFVVVPDLQATNFLRLIKLNDYLKVLWRSWAIAYPHVPLFIS